MVEKDSDTLLTFPCHFTLKVIGAQSSEFESAVYTIVHEHIPQFADTLIEMRPSKQGKYLALSLSVYVTSKAQLDGLYIALSSSPHVVMVI
ncbi:MAG TPA: DUF493 domain-containing protein [Gammaproteobacteria bacterium]|jgi:putative lipoic acid-binding regulatory protein|nr:DUF493 domain-containing protein [Gammaproteobacteria bacterium]